VTVILDILQQLAEIPWWVYAVIGVYALITGLILFGMQYKKERLLQAAGLLGIVFLFAMLGQFWRIFT
jgi:hypothetical protein